MSKAMGVLGGYVAGLAGPARHPRPARPAVPLLDVAPAGGSPPRAARRSGSCRTSRGGWSGCGRAPGGSRPSSPGSASTPAARRRRSRRSSWATRRRPAGSPAGYSRRASSPAGRLPDRCDGQGPDPDDRHRRPHRRPARPGARGVRPGGPRAGAHRRLSEPGASSGTDGPGPRPPARQPSPHEPVAGQRRPDRRLRRAGASSAGSPRSASRTTSTSTRHPAYDFSRSTIASGPSEGPPSVGRRKASRSGSGPRSPTTRGRRRTIRDHLRGHAYDFVIGSVHVYADSPFHASRVAAWVAGRPLGRDRRAVLRRGPRRDPVRAVRHDRPPRLREALPDPARDAGRPRRRGRSCTSRCSRPSSRPARRSR